MSSESNHSELPDGCGDRAKLSGDAPRLYQHMVALDEDNDLFEQVAPDNSCGATIFNRAYQRHD